MILKNTAHAYGLISKIFHWGLAALVIFMLCLGLYMDGVDNLTDKIKLYNLHKSLGVTVLILVTLRVFWHVYSTKPLFVDSLKSWEKTSAKGLHYFLYLCMFGMPLSGWLFSSAAGRPVSFFGMFNLPDMIGKNEAFVDLFKTIHVYLAYGLIAAVILHFLAALKHHFIDRDDTLRRMISMIALCFALSILPIAVAYAAPDAVSDIAKDVPQWQMISDQSALTFNGRQMGQGFQGVFNTFTADIFFAPDQLDQSHVDVTIDINGIDTGDTSQNDTIKGSDWFDIPQFPTARFASDSFKHIDKDQYEVSGNLTIRDVTLPLTFPFQLHIETTKDNIVEATMQANINIDRTQFNLGQGEWADPNVIENNVMVNIKLVAHKITN